MTSLGNKLKVLVIGDLTLLSPSAQARGELFIESIQTIMSRKSKALSALGVVLTVGSVLTAEGQAFTHPKTNKPLQGFFYGMGDFTQRPSNTQTGRYRKAKKAQKLSLADNTWGGFKGKRASQAHGQANPVARTPQAKVKKAVHETQLKGGNFIDGYLESQEVFKRFHAPVYATRPSWKQRFVDDLTGSPAISPKLWRKTGTLPQPYIEGLHNSWKEAEFQLKVAEVKLTKAYNTFIEAEKDHSTKEEAFNSYLDKHSQAPADSETWVEVDKLRDTKKEAFEVFQNAFKSYEASVNEYGFHVREKDLAYQTFAHAMLRPVGFLNEQMLWNWK